MSLQLPVIDNLLSFSNLKSLVLGPSSLSPPGGNQPFRPPQWKGEGTGADQLIYVKTNIAEQGESNDFTTGQIGYFFDVIMRVEHETTTRITEHPVQNGANISDHAYMMPARLVMEIGMSDAMDTLVSGQFSDRETKSISAYQTLLRLQKNRQPLQVTTRLNIYQNMIIENINAPDDIKTLYGLKATVTMRQIMTAQIGNTKISLRDQASVAETPKGSIQPVSLIKEKAATVTSTITGARSGAISSILGDANPIKSYTDGIPVAVQKYMNKLYPETYIGSVGVLP